VGLSGARIPNDGSSVLLISLPNVPDNVVPNLFAACDALSVAAGAGPLAFDAVACLDTWLAAAVGAVLGAGGFEDISVLFSLRSLMRILLTTTSKWLPGPSTPSRELK
jgi:hypothetical protein